MSTNIRNNKHLPWLLPTLSVPQVVVSADSIDCVQMERDIQSILSVIITWTRSVEYVMFK
jgi:hypothetical protein